MMILFGATYAIFAFIVTLMFDYEPNPRRFKRAMALAMLPLALFLGAAIIQDVVRYPASHELSDIVLAVAHILVIAWLSQFAARKYLRELSLSRLLDEAG